MITSLYIDNFKALNDFTIKLKPLTVLIGENACGKSSVLQAVSLILSLVRTDLEKYVRSRNWSFGDVKSQLSGKKNITLKTVFEFELNRECQPHEIEWEFIFTPVKKDERIYIRSERVINMTTRELLLEAGSQGILRHNAEKDETETFPSLNLSASFIKNIDELKDASKYPVLACIKKFLVQSDPFDLFVPEKLSLNSRGQADTIGAYGENMAAFIHGLSQQQRERLNSRLRKYSGFISELNTKKQGKGLGWIEMSASEKFINRHTNIKAMHLSDGILRIIAIAALAEMKKNTGIVLLEEIENGINPHIAEILTRDIREISDKNRRQVVLTTHNPVLLDFFSEESIVFLWRNKNGMVSSSDMFANEKVREYLEYMYPGEVWLNMSGKELVENLQTGH